MLTLITTLAILCHIALVSEAEAPLSSQVGESAIPQTRFCPLTHFSLGMCVGQSQTATRLVAGHLNNAVKSNDDTPVARERVEARRRSSNVIVRTREAFSSNLLLTPSGSRKPPLQASVFLVPSASGVDSFQDIYMTPSGSTQQDRLVPANSLIIPPSSDIEANNINNVLPGVAPGTTLDSLRHNLSAIIESVLHPGILAPPNQSQVYLENPQQECIAGGDEGAIGTCYSASECHRRGGRPEDICQSRGAGGVVMVCCVFQYTCGDVTVERSTYFRSPDFPGPSSGTLACDFDMVVQKDVCAVRLDLVRVHLARRLGGTCDVDQLLILNSVDGPISPLCGPMSSYSTTVAVNPGQKKPLKVALLIQNEEAYLWNLQLSQIRCGQFHRFSSPQQCGRRLGPYPASGYPGELPSWRRSQSAMDENMSQHGTMWWSFPEAQNTFYHGVLKKQMQQMTPESKSAEDRIVGGQDASQGEFPWQAALLLDRLFFCGGSLINHQFVLTAAHCVMTRDTPVALLRVILGALDLTVPNELGSLDRGVRRLLFHSHFQPFLLDNDVALLQLDSPVPFSTTIFPICLPDSGWPYTGLSAWVTGWGITSFPAGEPSAILQRLHVQTLGAQQCAQVIEEPLGPAMICAVPTQPGQHGTCFGDSGGPLSVEVTTAGVSRTVLVGIVSFGVTGCAALPKFPDIYTRVSEYLRWIDVHTSL